MSDYLKKTITGVSVGVGLLAAIMASRAGMASQQTGTVTKVVKSHRSDDPVMKYILDNSLRLHPVQEELAEVTSQHQWSRMASAPDEMQLLGNLCKVIKAKKTLDIGVFTGISALSIALTLPEDGRLVACDVSEEFVNIGRPFWKKAGVDKKIDVRIAPATETLQSLLDAGEAGTYDFAYIDADKTSYDQYYELCLKLLRSGGIIAVDNVLWSGSVADPSKNSPDTVALRNLNTKLATDTRINVSMLNIGDGCTLAFKV